MSDEIKTVEELRQALLRPQAELRVYYCQFGTTILASARVGETYKVSDYAFAVAKKKRWVAGVDKGGGIQSLHEFYLTPLGQEGR